MPRIRNAQIDLLSQMDELMAKSIVTVAAAVSILSLGSLVSAQAGGATRVRTH